MNPKDRLQIVTAFHGTSKRYLPSIRASGLRVSSNTGSWLGRAIYVWLTEEAAWRWARECFGEDACVIEVEIVIEDPSQCIDLVDELDTWRPFLRRAAEAVQERRIRIGLPQLTQVDDQHWLDCAVFDQLLSMLAKASYSVQLVRCRFSDEDPIYPGSAIFDSQIQIGVFDPGIIRVKQVITKR